MHRFSVTIPQQLSRRLLCGLLLLGTSQAYAAETPPSAETNQGSWEPYKVKHGVAVERRAVAGSRFFEYRAMVTAPLPPETIIDHLWSHVTDGNAAIIKKRQVLKQAPTEIVLYDQIRTPVVSDRDYTLIIRKQADASAHRYKMTFETANQLGPPVDPNYVRIPAIRGAWAVEPDDKGGSRLTYQSFSEPGGSIPAFMIHGAQFDQVIHDIERVQERLRNLPASK